MKRLSSRLLLCAALLFPSLARADWASDRDGSVVYVPITVLASVVDEAVPFFIVYGSSLPSEFHDAMDDAGDTDGRTIRASNADGSTQLACVPIGVNTTTDTFCLAVLGTGMSASVDVEYRLYVGNSALSMPSASGGMGEQAVFAAYKGVYFPGVDGRDFTVGGRNLTTNHGTAASGYEGITAATYNGSSQYDHYNGTPAVTSWPMTIECLSYSANTTQNHVVCGLAKTSSSTVDQVLIRMSGSIANDPTSAGFIGGSGSLAGASINTYSASTWYYLAGTRDANSGTTTHYRDVSSATDTTTIASFSAPDETAIGARVDSVPDSFLDGRVAVMLLDDTAHTSNYIATQYDNWNGDLYSVGSAVPLSDCGSGTTGLLLFGSNSQTSTANANWNDLSASLADDANTTDVSLDDGGVYESETITYSGADLSAVPAGASSYTVKIYIKRRGDTNSGRKINDLVVRFRDGSGTLQGDNLANLAGVWPTTAATATYTLTGYSPDGTDFTSSTGLDLQATGIDTNGATTAEVYTVWIEVLWEGAPCDEGSNWFSMWD